MACFFKLSFHAVLICIVPLSFATDEAGQHDLPIRELIISSYQESLQLVDEAPLHSRQRRNEPSSSTHMFTFHRQTDPETLEISRAAEVFQTTLQVLKNKARQRYKRDVTALELLSSEDIALIGKLSKCPATHLTVCPHFSKYRSISGLCNNRQIPLWGAANTPMVRWLPAEYEDGERQPKGWNRGWLHNGFQLPPPREVSTDIIKSSFKSKDEAYSVLLVEWGQYMSHDITFTPQSTGLSRPTVDCLSTCENLHPCFPIETHDGCMPFHRSLPACFVNPELNIEQALQRQQMNSITSFMDASVLYGHSLKMESFLRDLSGLNGKLAVNDLFTDPKGRPYLPFVDTLPSTCRQNQEGERVECFSAGDTRANEAIPLTTLHTLWLREHNRIAEALKGINRHWTPETIYQETRKIIGALHQVIYIRDYVPKIIGSASFEHYIGPYGGYDPTTDPSTANVFATAAFRFGHATIPPILMRLNESFQAHEDFPHLRLRDTFFSPWRIVKEDEMKTEINPAGLATVANCMEVYFWKCRGLYSSVVMTQGGIEPVLRGIIGTAAPAVNSNMLLAEDVTESLVISKIDRHMDLASLNLQRGRDHGLPGYNDWRVFCGLKYIKTLEDLKEVVGDNKVAEEIQKKYQHLDNIDVWLGGLVEKLLPGSRTGPLFACLIGKQMRVLRDGDRFWWEAEGMFTQQQKAELVKASLSRIICDNSDVREVPYDPFRFETYPSNYLPCNHLPSINLEAWREERSSDLEKCGSPAKIKNGDFILSSASGKLMALYSCYHGFQLKGAAAVVCEGNRWSDQAPQCKGNHH